MMMASSARLLLAPLGGGLAMGLLWLLVNFTHRGAAGGWLEQQSWPLSSLYACAALGAALGLLQAIGQGHLPRRPADLGPLADRLGLSWRPEPTLDDLAGGVQLQIFSRWQQGWDRLSGRFEGLDVQMIDFAAAESYGSGLARGATRSQTVVVIRVRTAGWPIFRVCPHGFGSWLWGLLGCRGLRFRFRDERLVSAPDQQALRRFNRRYYVFVGVAARVLGLAGLDAGLSLGDSPLEGREVADRFSLDTLRHFAASRGWSVESCGTHVAFWRSGRLLPPGQRETFLHEASALYRALEQPARSPADARLEVEPDAPDPAQLGRRAVGLIGGAVVGMLLAMLTCFPLLAALPFDVARWAILVWPLAALLAMATGAYVGARLAASNRFWP